MLSLPITILQVAMFSLCSAAASAPGSTLATVAQIIPFSSPLAMAARAATDDARGIHLLALGWQAIWVALVIMLSVRLFRSEEHTSELQSLMRISYAVFCLKKKKNTNTRTNQQQIM